jgi:hypothetical protein
MEYCGRKVGSRGVEETECDNHDGTKRSEIEKIRDRIHGSYSLLPKIGKERDTSQLSK